MKLEKQPTSYSREELLYIAERISTYLSNLDIELKIYDKNGNNSIFTVEIESVHYSLAVINWTSTDMNLVCLKQEEDQINYSYPFIPATEHCLLELKYKNSDLLYFMAECNTSSYIESRSYFGSINIESLYPVEKRIQVFTMWNTI